jgi:hypothetical protein
MKTKLSLFPAIFFAATFASQLPVQAVEKSLSPDEKMMLQFLANVKRTPKEYGYRLKLNWDLYRTFKNHKRPVRARMQLRQLYQEIRAVEALPRPTKELVGEMVCTLDQMSEDICPQPDLDSPQLKGKKGVSEQAFLIAESLQKRKLRMLDKLSTKDNMRMYGHQLIVSWYESFGKNEAAEQQKRILIALATKNMNEENAKQAAKNKAALDAMDRCGCKCRFGDSVGGFH